jgi:transposase-like protein
MTAKKLSDVDKDEIIGLYRIPEETAATLAERYGVSSSTISRFLKSHLSESDYGSLTQQKQKRHTRSGNRSPQDLVRSSESVPSQVADSSEQRNPKRKDVPLGKAVSVGSRLLNQPIKKTLPESSPPPLGTLENEEDLNEENDPNDDEVGFITVETMLGEDIEDDDDEDIEDDDDEDIEDDDDDRGEDTEFISFRGVQVLPLSEASLPQICYLVIDRASELITRPLKDFDHLGTIPTDEFQEKTLPVFDNHRVARRFSNHRGKVIKVPDGKMLRKTSSYLKSKGITRLLIDGQVYSLSREP